MAVLEQIFLQRLQLQARLAGHVTDGQDTEVGEAGLRADGREFGIVDQDLIGLELVGPGVD